MSNRTHTSKSSPSNVTMIISFLTHALLLAPVIYILVLSCQTFNYFSWHPICGTLGIGLLILEAIYCISGEAYLSAKWSRRNRVILHWVLNVIGLGFLVVCFLIIFISKANAGKRHFTSNHGKLGLAAFILCLTAILFGILADNTKWFYPKIRPVTLKIAHSVFGMLVMIVLLATVINGTYTRWWPGTELGRDLTFASFVIGTALIMVKPILGAVSKSKVVCCPTSSNT